MTKKRAAIYLRISLDAEMDGLAIDRQREDCEKIAHQRNWKIVEVYVDQSISASKKDVDRPSYERMRRDFLAGHFNALICYDLDRLTRQPRQLEDWIDACQDKDLVLVTANGEADLSTDAGRLFAGIKINVARAETERKGARQKRAQQQRAKQGRPPKGIRPHGYKLNGEIIEAEAENVKQIYKRFLAGISLNEIASKIELPRQSYTLAKERNEKRRAEGKPEKPLPENGVWPVSTILDILRNPRYAGYSVYHGKSKKDRNGRPIKTKSSRQSWRENIVIGENGEPIKGQWEPIIDEATWWSAQSILDDPARVTNRSGSTVRKHLGAGLYKCETCGKRVQTRGIYYSCPQGHLNRSRKLVDDFVKRVFAKRLEQADATKTRKVAIENDEYIKRINEQQARITRAQEDYDNGFIEAYDLKRVRDKARDQIVKLEREQTNQTSGSALRPILATSNPSKAFQNAPISQQRLIIDTLATITLKPGKRGIKGFNPESIAIEWKN